MHFILWIGLALTGLLLAAGIWEASAAALDRRLFPPPGILVDVGGRRLHLNCTGEGGGPTVVIAAGRFNTSPVWSLVQPEIARFARVCTYDRAGYAWSDPDPGPRTGARVAADLHTLLHKAEIPGPYLLVGHSLGSMYIRCFAQAYPNEVAGLILVDPYTEGEVRGEPPKSKAMQTRFVRLARFASLVGIPRLAVPLMRGMAEQLHRFPRALQARIIGFSVSSRLWRAVDSEWREVEGMARHELGGPGSLGDKPLLVLSADRFDMKAGGGYSQAEVDSLWRLIKESQAELTRLSSRGRLVGLPDTGHGVPLERPEAIVAAVREMLA